MCTRAENQCYQTVYNGIEASLQPYLNFIIFINNSQICKLHLSNQCLNLKFWPIISVLDVEIYQMVPSSFVKW